MNEAKEFKREYRYQVIKLKTGLPVECVVVEADWPEYETVFRMIQARVEGKPNELAELKAENERLRAEHITISKAHGEGFARATLPLLEKVDRLAAHNAMLVESLKHADDSLHQQSYYDATMLIRKALNATSESIQQWREKFAAEVKISTLLEAAKDFAGEPAADVLERMADEVK